MQIGRQTILTKLAGLAESVAEYSYAPYSGNGCGCVILLSDGTWVPGVRVESASFPLLIPAGMNAVTTAIAAGRSDFVAAVSNRGFSGADQDYLSTFFPDAAFSDRTATSSRKLVQIGERLDPLVHADHIDDATLAELTRRMASRAHVPESNFPVGCILETADGGLIPGCNVEHSDWNLILCAERNAVGTAVTYRLNPWRRLHVSCIKDPSGSPCGACRQVLVEHAPDMPLVMDRGNREPEIRTAADLLPDYFGGTVLRKKQK